MFNILSGIYLLMKANPFYKEIESILEPDDNRQYNKLEVETQNYYWFTFSHEIYLMYFDDSSLNHENSFVLFVVIPEAKSKGWPDIENDQLLVNAFDNFHLTSAFISLLPHEQNRTIYYVFSAEINGQLIHTRIKMGSTLIFMSQSFQLKKLTNYVVMQIKVKVGSRFWNCFYRKNDSNYGLFMKTYYIYYQPQFENAEKAVLFRVAGLDEIAIMIFTPSLMSKKVLPGSGGVSFTINFIQSVTFLMKNRYRLWVSFPVFSVDVIFDLQENKNQQFQILIGNLPPEEEAGTPEIEKLPQTGQRVYLFKKDSQEKLTVEIPTYFWDQKLEISTLIVSFKFTVAKLNESPMVRTYFRIYEFKNSKNSFWFTITCKCNLSFEKIVEDRNIVLKPTSLMCLGQEYNVLTPVEIEKKPFITNKKGTLIFLNGSVVYEQDSRTTPVPPEFHIKEKRVKPRPENESTQSDKRRTNKVIYLLVGFALLFVCFLGGTSFFYSKKIKKNLSKKRKFSSRRNK